MHQGRFVLVGRHTGAHEAYGVIMKRYAGLGGRAVPAAPADGTSTVDYG
jgi:hypothetical protein